MRPTQLVMMLRLLASGAPGVLCGSAVAGLLAILSGHVAISDVAAALVLMPVGAVCGLATARLTTTWLLSHAPYRYTVMAVVGAGIFPLLTGIGQLHSLAPVGAILILGGGACTMALRLRTRRTVARQTHYRSRVPSA